MNMAPIFLWNRLRLGTYANSAALRTALLQWCYSSRNFGANPKASDGNGTSADDDNRMQVVYLKKGKGKGKGKHQNQEGNRTTSRPTRALQTSTRARTVAELDIGQRTAGDKVEERTAIPPVTTATRIKARAPRRAKGKANTWMLWKRLSLLRQLQPCRIFHKHRVRSELSRAIQTWNRGSWV